MGLLGNISVEGAPSTLISPAEMVGKVELGKVRVERQKLGEGGEGRDEIVKGGGGGESGTLSMVGVWLGVGDFWLGGVGEWIWEEGADGSLFSFEGCRPWWRETLKHHAEKKKRRQKFRIEGSNEFSCEGSNI